MFHESKANEVLFGGAAGGGKELWVGTPIPTPNGWKRMGDLAEGDKVFGPDGHAHAVVKATPVRLHPAWRFVFDDGAEVICNDEHLWLTYDAKELAALTRRTDEFRARRRANRPSRATGSKGALVTELVTARNQDNPPETRPAPTGTVRTAAQIVATLRTRSGRANHAIPVSNPLELPQKDLLVDPYVLGLWLGDGTARDGGFTNPDGLEKAFSDAGFEVVPRNVDITFGVRGLSMLLRKIGVLGNKHIPEEYLWACKEQRLSLLQGLMDTDGCCNKNGSAEFTSTNRRIAEGTAQLIRSLGMKCTVREGRARIRGRDCGPKWTIKFTPCMPVFRLERKLKRQKPQQRRTTRFRYLVKAERLEALPMRCIAIDSADHLYLAGESFVPTHNSKAIVMDALMRCLRWPNTSAYIFRRTYTELEDTIITEAKRSIPDSVGRYNVGRHEVNLLNGSKIHFRHCASIGDMYNYSGAEIHWLYFDELTTFEQKIYDFLKTRLRAKKSLGIVPIVRSSSNPGSIGHGWVKKMFVTAGPYMELIRHEIPEPEDGKIEYYTTQYIPSLATENPHISDEYKRELRKKPKALRDALLYGHWDAFEGQVFVEFTDDPEHYSDGLKTHVITPFVIPSSWARYRTFDWGKSRPFSVGWWAVAPNGTFYRYREWYGSNGTPNVGLGITVGEIAQGIQDIEKGERDEGIRFTGIADPHIFDVDTGESTAEIMARYGIYFNPGDNSRIEGKLRLHEALRFGPDQRPGLYVFTNCVDFIRTIPELPYSLTKVEDVDSESEDHIYDETRYFLMSWPYPGKDRAKPPIKTNYDDPFGR